MQDGDRLCLFSRVRRAHSTVVSLIPSAWINTRRRFLNTSKPFSYQQTCLFGKVTHRVLKELFHRIVEIFKLTDNRFDFTQLPHVFRNPNQTCWGIRQTLKERSILWSLYNSKLGLKLYNFSILLKLLFYETVLYKFGLIGLGKIWDDIILAK